MGAGSGPWWFTVCVGPLAFCAGFVLGSQGGEGGRLGDACEDHGHFTAPQMMIGDYN